MTDNTGNEGSDQNEEMIGGSEGRHKSRGSIPEVSCRARSGYVMDNGVFRRRRTYN